MEEKYVRNFNSRNRAKRLPVCFCIDTSGSMNKIVEGYDEAIDGKGTEAFIDQQCVDTIADRPGLITLADKMNEGIKNFYKAIGGDFRACDSCEVAIVTFNDEPKLYDGFSSVEEKKLPDFTKLITDGNTYMTPAIEMALDLLEEQMLFYKKNNARSFKPWLVLFTDGLPSDDVTLIKRRLKDLQERGELFVYTVALSDKPGELEGARGFSLNEPINASDPKVITQFFHFLSKSVSAGAQGVAPKAFKADIPDNVF